MIDAEFVDSILHLIASFVRRDCSFSNWWFDVICWFDPWFDSVTIKNVTCYGFKHVCIPHVTHVRIECAKSSLRTPALRRRLLRYHQGQNREQVVRVDQLLLIPSHISNVAIDFRITYMYVCTFYMYVKYCNIFIYQISRTKIALLVNECW